MTIASPKDEIRRLACSGEKYTVFWGTIPVVWRKFGSGSPLVLIHGGYGNWLHWVKNIEPLSWKHTVWVPDLPSMGESGTMVENEDPMAALKDMAAALVATFSQLVDPETEIDIAGFSLGGAITALFAQQWTTIRRMALLGTSGHGQGRRQTKDMISWRKLDGRAQQDAFRHNLMSLMLQRSACADDLALEVYEATCRECRFRGGKLTRQSIIHDMLETFRSPILFIWGEGDVTANYPAKVADWLSRGRRGRKWAVLPGGHWIQYENADTVNQMLLCWFSDFASPCASVNVDGAGESGSGEGDEQ
ncbi:2-hydroxy-6-oxo-6-phenylhexa-2,4-dienoate hydrolase [Paraburkholderia unamae]|uniref:alpha/beta fold hydrolase n=1 Tax=Paraburkholderia unamae TaxID=219649 RepID=UPI001CB11D40|nr:2-hydroxy-6-oxo-6-phenylhexa-2,4-dienoate hydrolase [Paraburkholderia unamae]